MSLNKMGGILEGLHGKSYIRVLEKSIEKMMQGTKFKLYIDNEHEVDMSLIRSDGLNYWVSCKVILKTEFLSNSISVEKVDNLGGYRVSVDSSKMKVSLFDIKPIGHGYRAAFDSHPFLKDKNSYEVIRESREKVHPFLFISDPEKKRANFVCVGKINNPDICLKFATKYIIDSSSLKSLVDGIYKEHSLPILKYIVKIAFGYRVKIITSGDL